MRDLLQARKAGPSHVSKKIEDDYYSPVFEISGRSIEEVDHLIEGLKGVREKLNRDGDRLQHEISQYDAFCQSILQLTNIVSEGMAALNSPAAE